MKNPKPHELNGDGDELFELAAGTYSSHYLRWYVKEHGDVPPEIDAASVDATDRIARHGDWTLGDAYIRRYTRPEGENEA